MPKSSKNLKIADVISKTTGKDWVYSKIVKDHFFHPRNLLLKNPKRGEFDAEGQIGAPQCGDVMRMWVKIDPETEKIKELKWRTFGCGSAIATTSIFSVIVTEKGGMKIADALLVRPQDIMKRLGGLPARKVHCSVLADKAFGVTINDYFRKTGQHQKIITEGTKVIDKKLNITDKDIEEAVLEGAISINDLQKRLKVGIGDPGSLLEIEQLLKFYQEKYYGSAK